MQGHPLAGKVVVVTGASGGVGRATAVALAKIGARVALLARGEQGLAAAAAEIEDLGSQALPIVTDVADAAAVSAAAARVESDLGPIEVWINNAMATIFSPVEEIAPEEFRRATEVTYLGAVYGTMAALDRMKRRDRGTIVQVGSALGFRAIPLQSAYCGAKYALRGFTDSLRCELIHDRSPIHVTMVHLAGMNTPQFDWARNHFDRRPQPVPPCYQPEVAAEAIVWAACHRRRAIWVGLPTFQTILGNRVAPGLMDRMMAGKAYEGQLTDEPERPGRPDNLFSPVAGDFGAHGRFDDTARSRSLQLVMSEHSSAAALGAAALLLAAGAGLVGAIALGRRRARNIPAAQSAPGD